MKAFFLMTLLTELIALSPRMAMAAEAVPNTDAKAPAKAIRVVLAGDSTVADRSGWGEAFAKLLGPNATCLNLAQSGRSSKSFRARGNWQKVLDAKPNYVLMQFGHNDQPGKGPDRETDAKTTYYENMARFVEEVRAAGASPILVTSVSRRNFKDGQIREDGLAPYVEAVRKLAKDQKVPLVDLYARSVEHLNKIGPDATEEYNPQSSRPGGTPDRTHLTAKGGEAMALLVAEELRSIKSELAKELR
jgi:lysophospholipase L1-like esterase